MGATRRNSRRIQRRDIAKVRKIIKRETDRRLEELMRQQEREVQAASDGWDPFEEG